ncbi:MAG: DNA primase [bacterium]
MKTVSKQTIEEIRNACDIADVIGERIQLKRSGAAVKGLCPFHKEKTPSFSVNSQRQIFHCFGCGAGGDVFKFIMQYENVDFGTAMRMLAQRAGVRIELDEVNEGEAKAKDVLYKIHEELAQFYHRILLENAVAEGARTYLASRDLGPEIVEQFLLGFAPARYNTIRTWAEKKGYTLDQLEAAGFLSRGESDGGQVELYDRFRNRLMFPIRDREGRVIAFSGRILEADAKAAKYVNSPETPLFRKGRVLYALDRAWRPILDAKTAILCEGQIDVIRCHAAGITTAVAAQGTAFTEDHARMLNRYADAVILMMDADTAGQTSAVKSARILLATGLSVSVVKLPTGEDPDSLIRKSGASAIQNLIAHARSALDFQIDVLIEREDLNSDAGLKRATAEVFETLAVVPSAALQDQMLRAASQRLGFKDSELREDLQKRLKKVARPSWEEAKDAPVKPIEHPMGEVDLAKMLAHHPECAGLVSKYLPLQYITDQDCRTIIGLLLKTGADLNQELADAPGECQRLAAEILQGDAKSLKSEVAPEVAVQDMIIRLRHKAMDAQRGELTRRRDTATGEDFNRLDAEYKQLVLDMKNLRDGWERARPILELHG